MDFEARTNERLKKIKERLEIIEQLKKTDQVEKNILTNLAELIQRTQTLIEIMERPVKETWLVNRS